MAIDKEKQLVSFIIVDMIVFDSLIDNCFIIQQIDNKTNNFIWPGKDSFIYSLACCGVQNYVYRRVSVT